MSDAVEPRSRLLRLVMRMYPRRLRREYGAEMSGFLDARLDRCRSGRWGVVRVYAWAVQDLALTWAAERRARRKALDGDRPKEGGMGAIVQDLRYAVRRLVRSPVFSLGAVAIVAIAIGANTAVFAVVKELLFTPPPYGEPDQVVNIYQDSDDGEPGSTAFPAYRDMTDVTGVFVSVAASSPDVATLERNESRERVAIEFTTSNYLAAIGRQPLRGRWFDAAMDRVGAGHFAVVSEYAWKSRFGADPSMIGSAIRLNGQPVTVIGVGPSDFNGAGGFIVTDFWLSISSVGVGGSSRVSNLERREDHWYDVKARLAPGVSVAQAQQAMDALAGRMAEAFPELDEGRGITVFRATDIRVHPEFDGDLYTLAGILATIVVLVLVLASSNLGSLLLVRGVVRYPEIAVRRALGAGSRRVAALFLGEGLILSVVGGAFGILLARWVLALLATTTLPPPLQGSMDFTLDVRVLLFGAGLMVATGLFFGVAPALQSLRTDLSGTLREERRSIGSGRRLSRLRNAMVSVQVAVSLMLVMAAAVMMRGLAASRRVDPGVDVDRVAYLLTKFAEAGIPANAAGATLNQLRDRFAAVPGVTGVAVASRLPVQRAGTTTTVVEGYEPAAGTGSVELPWAVISPEYFATLGIGVLHGRSYSEEDETSEERIVIVNETAARRFWGTADAVGRRIRPQSSPEAWTRVIGVVEDTRVASLDEPPTPLLYYVMRGAVNSPYILVRTAADPSAVLGSLRAQLRLVDARLPVEGLGTLESHLGASLAADRASAGLLSLFSILALLLASVGIYTIVSFTVAGRVPEIGMRIALGAARARVIRMVVGEMAATVGLGLIAGATLILAVGSRLGPESYRADLLDPATLAGALLILCAAVTVASYLPARRAARIDPAHALRSS